MNMTSPLLTTLPVRPTPGPRISRAESASDRLTDSYGRVIDHLRISVTDRCNLRCTYCMSEGAKFTPQSDLLTFDEIVRFVRVLAPRGVRKLRITGGEPTMRKGLPELVQELYQVEGIDDIAITTNGVLLEEQAEPLFKAGLRRINVSLDTLARDKFCQLTRRDSLVKVIKGLSEAQRVGFWPIKINVVAIQSFTDEEFLDFALLARSSGHQVRFIEFMPLDGEDDWGAEKVVPARDIVAQINACWPLEPVPTGRSGAATLYRFRDGTGGQIGVIPSVTDPFCGRCNRIRLTPDGKLRTCLFSLRETDVRAPLRRGDSDEQLAELVASAVRAKEPGHQISQSGFVRPSRTMSCIGG